MDELNLRLRSKILYCALKIEESVNQLLVSHLLITQKELTKNFGNKAGISFKNKIDLLYDINVLSKDEYNEIDLLMNIRNKFLHDIKYVNFKLLINDLDNGIKNRFLKFNLTNKNEEEDYELTFENLYDRIVEIIKLKLLHIINISKIKVEFLKFQGEYFTETNKITLLFAEQLRNKFECIENNVLKSELTSLINGFESDMNYDANIKKFISFTNQEIIKEMIKS